MSKVIRNCNDPRKLIGQAMQDMKDYNVPIDGLMVDSTDIGVIVAVILYFIAKEPSICATKLECYLIFLDEEARKATGKHLFHWSLTGSCRIKNFNKIIDFMVSKQLISHRSNHQFYLLKDILNIKTFPAMLGDIHSWLSSILNKYYFYKASDMLAELKSFCDCPTRTSNKPQTPPKPSGTNIQKIVESWQEIIKKRTEAFEAQFHSKDNY